MLLVFCVFATLSLSVCVCVRAVPHGEAICVQVDSNTKYEVGADAKLTCIWCQKRQEIEAIVDVKWTFTPQDSNILEYKSECDDVDYLYCGEAKFTDDRLTFNKSKDLQELSIVVKNVSKEDSGTYKCIMKRVLKMDVDEPPRQTKTITIELEILKRDLTSVISEIMMYFMIVASTLCLAVTLVVCYKQVEQADLEKRGNVTDYLVIAPVNKEGGAGETAEEEIKETT
uniref:Sodium channel regulatory subunit beta-3 n=1 Tax=Eptatretus burgeri TaxID=7764 RepID=A0A8C4R8J6_EPTBU